MTCLLSGWTQAFEDKSCLSEKNRSRKQDTCQVVYFQCERSHSWVQKVHLGWERRCSDCLCLAQCVTFNTLGKLSIKKMKTHLEIEWIPLMNKNVMQKKVKCYLMSLWPIKGRNLLFTSLCCEISLKQTPAIVIKLLSSKLAAHYTQSIISYLRKTLSPYQSFLLESMLDKNFIVGSVSPTLPWLTVTLTSTFSIWKAEIFPKYHKKGPLHSCDYLL